MTYVYEYVVGSDNVKVEYCLSSISNAIKVVEMWVNGKFHRTNWMSPEGNKMLMNRLENDYIDNHSTMSHPDFDAAMNGEYSTDIDLDRDMPTMGL